MARTTVRLEGFRDLEQSLKQLSKAAGKGVLRRAGMKALEPMAELARSMAPEDTGELKRSIAVSAKAKGGAAEVGKAEYAAALRAGGSKADAVGALRTARRQANEGTGVPVVELYMGPEQARSKQEAIKAIVMEYGSFRHTAQPYMRPAWDRDHQAMLERLKDDLGREIDKAVARAAARAARKAAAA